MRYVHALSIVITAAGVAFVMLGMTTGLDPVWTLVGLLLTWAGLTKIIAAYLWRGIFSVTGQPSEGNETTPRGSRRRGVATAADR